MTSNNDVLYRVSANAKVLASLFFIVIFMTGLAYASVPLYKLFCQITGYGGTTQVTENTSTAIILDHPLTVRFDANVNRALNWKFEPINKPITINPGEEIVVDYRATNLGSESSTGTSTFNVTPAKAGAYFMKMECFCFQEQTLQPGESVDMPVKFFVDPEIVADENVSDVKEITLSYTFFPAIEKNVSQGKVSQY